MKCCYHPAYQVPLPPGHPFPISKYPLLKEQLLAEHVIEPGDLVEPDPIDLAIASRVHTAAYLDKLVHHGLSAAEQRRLGLPWSADLWHRSRLAAGGTLLAARTALKTGLAANMSGGTHHAFADHAEGFCVLNDVAIAAVQLLAEGAITRAVVIDLDVHQGNGTAAIFEGRDEVFTFSMHGERNYPSLKMRSDVDVGLSDRTGDAEYLDALRLHLPQVLERSRPDIAFYLAGVDVCAGDRYGKLSLSEEGLRLRDRFVIESVRNRNTPLAIVLGGGYASTRALTAHLHAHVFREAIRCERRALDAQAQPPV